MPGIETHGRVLFVFLDGVGIGPADPDRNPFLRTELPVLRGLLGGGIPTLDAPESTSRAEPPSTSHGRRSKGVNNEPAWRADNGLEAVAFPLDATLGVGGLPQSGTGHTALFTGKNAPRLYGRHFGPWVPVRLRALLKERGLLARLVSGGASCAFANAYPRGFEASPWGRRPAGPPLMASAAGLLVRHEEALARGEALASEIVNTGWRTYLGRTEIPEITPAEAGVILAGIAARHHFTLFAHYGTDHAGHRGVMSTSTASLERVDAFLGGVLGALPPRTLLVLASDHGNIEEVGGSHTRNPTLAVLAGPGAWKLRKGLGAITDLTPAILGRLLGAA